MARADPVPSVRNAYFSLMEMKDHPKTSSIRGVRRGVRRWVLLLLIVPFIGTLWVSTFASVTPELWGIPFFYWYQFLWIGISAAITIIVYIVEGSVYARRGDSER